jgi:O-antigen ligase
MNSLARRVGSSINVINNGHVLPHVPRPFGAVFTRMAGLVLTAFLCQSFFWSPANPWALKVAVAAVALLAACRPDVALLVLAAVVPFGRVISTVVFHANPARFAEAVVLGYLVGWLWSRVRREVPERSESPGLVLGCLFGAVVAASLLVELGVLRYWKDYWQPFLGQLLAYLARDYLDPGIETRPWATALGIPAAHTAAILLEGVGLTRAAQVLCAGNPAFGRRLLWTLAIAAAGTATLSVDAAFALASEGGRSLLSVLQTDRIAAHIFKINTAASYFVLLIPVLIGLGVGSAQSRPRPLAIGVLRWTVTAAGSALLSAALWMTGSRSALLAGVVVTAGASVYAVRRRRPAKRTWHWAIAVVAACGVVSALLVFGFYMRTAALEAVSGTSGSLPVRVLMWQAALKTLAARPVFGVGVGQFPYKVAAFHPDAALSANFGLIRFNAHNQFLEVAAELGVIGGVLFVGMFAAILWRAWKAFRTSRDPALGGAIAGVVAFLITCLAGQPLLYEVVAFPFWMVLGVVLAGGDASPAAISAHQPGTGGRLKSRVIAWVLIVLALSIPVRVWQGTDQVNFALADYGFSGWYYPGDGEPYRLVRDEGTFFTYPHARRLRLPIRRDVLAGRNRLEVDVLLDGRRARTLTLADDEWQSVEFIIPADARRRFRRIDLEVRAPAGVAAQVRVAPAEISEDQTVEKSGSR